MSALIWMCAIDAFDANKWPHAYTVGKYVLENICIMHGDCGAGWKM